MNQWEGKKNVLFPDKLETEWRKDERQTDRGMKEGRI